MLPLVTLTETVNLDQKLQTGSATMPGSLDQSDIKHLPERQVFVQRNAADDSFNLEIPVQTYVESLYYEKPYVNLNNKVEISGTSSISEQVPHRNPTASDK